MQTFILLLTLIAQDGTALTKIEGFADPKQCITAGQIWADDIKKHPRVIAARYACIEQRSAK